MHRSDSRWPWCVLFLIAALTSPLVSPLQAQAPGVLIIDWLDEPTAGLPSRFTYGGTVRAPEGYCARLPAQWSFRGSETPERVQTDVIIGEQITFTPIYGVIYDVAVSVSYKKCDTGEVSTVAVGRNFFQVYLHPKITGLSTSPDPVLVDKPARMQVGSEWVRRPSRTAWTFGDGTSCADCSEHTYTTPGTYDATVVASNRAGSDTGTLRVVVKPDPPTAAAAFSTSSGQITAGSPVQFTGVIGGGERDRTILWDFGDGTTSSALNPVHTFNAADDYVVSLTVTNRWGTDRWIYSPFTVRPLSGGAPPQGASFTWSPQSPVTLQSVQFTDKSQGAVTRWRWNFDDGSPKVYSQNPSHVFTQWGRKNVELWVSNAYGTKGIIFFVDVLRHDTPPLANFSFAPFRATVGQPVAFTDTSFGATAWLWDFGEGGATSTQQNPTFTYSTPGQKSVTLKVTNAHGSDTVTKFFPCDHGTAIVLAANFSWSPLSPKPGEPVTFTDLSTGGPEKWHWVVSDGAQSSQRNFTHTFQTAGEYAVSLRVDKGTETKILVQTIRVAQGAGPVPNFAWTPASPEPGELVTFANLSQNASSYSWDLGDGTTSSAVSPQHRYAEARVYRVTLTAREGSLSETITKEVPVAVASAIPVASFLASPNPAQVGQEVRFTDTSSGRPTGWRWDFGYSNLTSREQNPRHSFPSEGTFLVTLTVSNATATSTPITLPVVVKRDQVKPSADFSWSPSDVVALEPVAFTDRSANNPASWKWTFGDGGTSTSANPSHTYARAGTFDVTLVAANSAGESTLKQQLVVGERRLQADFTFTPANPKYGDTVRFTDTSIGAPEEWSWLIDGREESNERTASWIFYDGGDHLVELTVRRGGKTSTKWKEVIVAAPPTASFRMNGKLKSGTTLTFTDTSDGNPKKRTWFINAVAAGTEPVLSRKMTGGVYNVKLLVENDIGADSVTRQYSISTEKKAPDLPTILEVKPRYGPCFYSIAAIDVPVDVNVDWKKQTPGSIGVEINGVATPSTKADSAKTLLPFETRNLDHTADGLENRLRFTAVTQSGATSEPMTASFFALKTPGYLDIANVKRTVEEPDRKTFVRGLYLPEKAWKGTITLPKILGGKEFGIRKAQLRVEHLLSTDCNVKSNVVITGGLALGPGFGGLKGSATVQRDVRNHDVNPKFSLGLEGMAGMDLTTKPLALMPGLSVPCELPIISSICNIAEIKLEVVGSVGGVLDFTFDDDGEVQFVSASPVAELNGKATASVGMSSAKFEVFGGSKGTLRLGPLNEEPLIRRGTVVGELGARFTLFGSAAEYKFESTCTYEPVKGFDCLAATPNAFGGDALMLQTVPLQPVPPLARSEAVEDRDGPPPILLRNVTPLADPAAAAEGDRAIVVYLGENESSGPSLQRLDVRAMRRNGVDWSASTNVTSDGVGDFNPTVALAANGRAVVAWERISNPALGYSDIPKLEDMPKLTRTVEIAVSTGDGTSWSTPSVLTSNELYDHAPALAMLSNGSTVLAWIREPADGKGAQQIVARVLRGDAWSAETIVASDLRGIGELALVAKSDEAHLVVAQGGDLALFVYRSDAWGTRTDVTKDAAADSSPSVIVEGNAVRVYWVRDNTLVTRVLPDAAIETVRTSEDKSPLVQPIAAKQTTMPAVIWSSGGDLRAVVRDPGTKQWSTDVVLSDDDTRHTASGAYFTPDGLLHLISLGTAAGRSDLVALDTALRVDLVVHGPTIAADPQLPNPNEQVTILVDVKNAGELPVRGAVVELRDGETVVASATGDWMPGQTLPVELSTRFASKELTIVVLAGNDATPENNIARYTFANRAPTACFQASVGSGSTPLTVSFDSSCSADADGRIARYAWSFPESGGAPPATAAVSHTFATPGTHPVLLTITDDMGATSTRSMTIDVAAPKNWRDSNPLAESLFLSVVARSPGVAGSFFMSDLAVMNTDQERDLTIEAVYLPDNRSDAYHRTITLGGGELLQTRDVLAQLFDAANGSGSLRLDLSHAHAIAVARTYNQQPTGTAGFSNEAMRRADALGDGETGVILQHWLPGYRTNIGFTEIAGVATEIVATAFDEKGATLGTERIALRANDHVQLNGRPLFQNRGRIEVTVQGGRVLAYGSTVDGRTGDPIYQAAARVPSATASSHTLLVPVVARLAGALGSTWRSDVRVFNPTAAAQTVSLELRTPSGTHTASLTLAAGETFSYDDVVGRAFPQVSGNVSAALAIVANAPLIASARTFNITDAGTYGLFVPARAAEELVAEGESAWLVQLQENSDYRCNLGITSFDTPVEVAVRAFDAQSCADPNGRCRRGGDVHAARPCEIPLLLVERRAIRCLRGAHGRDGR